MKFIIAPAPRILYPIWIELSLAHWKREGTQHGPKSTPTVIAFTWCRPDMRWPSGGRRLWVYFRGGYALHFDLLVDRRSLPPTRDCSNCWNGSPYAPYPMVGCTVTRLFNRFDHSCASWRA